jgi:hypothetical protein
LHALAPMEAGAWRAAWKATNGTGGSAFFAAARLGFLIGASAFALRAAAHSASSSRG